MAIMLVTLCFAQVNAQDLTKTIHVKPIKVVSTATGQEAQPFSLYKTELKAPSDFDFDLTRRSSRNTGINGFWDRDRDIDKYYPRRGTQNFVNVYLGLNNYLENDELPNSNSLLSLRPLGSWYLGLNFDNVTHVAGPIYLDWGVGASLQSFSFENTRVRVLKGADDITFTEESNIVGDVSKLSMSHINLHFVPTISFGRYSAFRVGFGAYAGYRINAQAKYKYDDANGNRQKDKITDNWFINPFRYGMRATIGWDSFDLFFNYDLTELFEDDINAPRLNPVTFGVIF